MDDKNTLDINGQAATVAPFDYQANLNVNLLDLGVVQVAAPGGRHRGREPANATAAKIEAAQTATTPARTRSTAPRAATFPPRPPPSYPKRRPKAVPWRSRSRARRAVPAARRFRRRATRNSTPETKLGGSLQVQWQAQGNFAKAPDGPKFSGGGTIKAHQVEYNAVGPLEADIEGKYSQQVIDFPVFFVGSNGLEFRTVIGLKDALARVDKISLKQGPTELLAGYIQIPLDLNSFPPRRPVPDVDKIDVNVASKPLTLETLFGSIDKDKKATRPRRAPCNSRSTRTAACRKSLPT